MGLASPNARLLNSPRDRLLRRISRVLDRPMTVLSFIWLALMIVDLGGRGLPYVVGLTLLITFAGAAAIYYFESPTALRAGGYLASEQPQAGIRSYGEGLWWTAMMLTTMGSDYFPKSEEGRVVALMLAIYAFAIFGYITAMVASLIIRVDRPDDNAAALTTQLQSLRDEIAQLRQIVQGESDRPNTC